MQKTLFKRYFSICVSLILVSMVICGIILMIFSSQYIKQEKYDVLITTIDSAIDKLQEKEQNGQLNDKIEIDEYLDVLSKITDAEIFIYNKNLMNAIYCTEQPPCTHTMQNINQSIIKTVDKHGCYKESGTLSDLYTKKYFTVGKPINNGMKEHIGYIFASIEVNKHFNTYLKQMFKMFLVSAIVVFSVVLIIINFVTHQMVKPLRDMSEAAKEFGKGDFSKCLPVDRLDEIGQLAMSMNNMAESLSVLENMRRSFISNVSHELKTPMTTIGGFIDGILDGTIPENQHKKYLRIVSDEVKRLSRVVRSMLNLAQIEAGELKLNPKKEDMIYIICQTLCNLEKKIEDKNLEIRGLDRDKVFVEADPDLIHQVIYNLVENAIKFSNDGGYIEFSFIKNSSNYLIGIKNSGEGLSREEIPRVFDRFYKTDRSRGLDKNGVGLGLYIVHSIINLHGGEIIVKSVKGEYCEFLFSLPVAKQTSKLKRKSEREDLDKQL